MNVAERDACRARLEEALGPTLHDAHLVAHTDQLAASLRKGLRTCGLDPTDENITTTLLLFAETFFVAHRRHAPFDDPRCALEMWAATAQLAAGALALDREQGLAAPRSST